MPYPMTSCVVFFSFFHFLCLLFTVHFAFVSVCLHYLTDVDSILIVDRLHWFRVLRSFELFRHWSVFISRVLVHTGDKALYWFVLVRVNLSRRVAIDLTMYWQVPITRNIDAVSSVSGIVENWFSERPWCGMQFREIGAENTTGPVSVFWSPHVVCSF